jgi:asparagine synthase (glutamine-hydrolysing)
MCGIAGFWDPRGRKTRAELEGRARLMARALVHRGPDDEATWAEESEGLAFGFRRLAIIDLTREGAQPMRSASGRYVVAFNGEIYNYKELRREIEGLCPSIAWRGSSDTEVMLACFEQWGVEAAMRRLQGMFALCIWDGVERNLHLVRDRLGEKPLFYGWSRGVLLFGSELKALVCHPDWQGEIDRESLLHFMRLSYVPTPRSIYRGIGKLKPGIIATFSSLSFGNPPRETPYWRLEDAVARGLEEPIADESAGVERLDFLLREAVRRQMVADVPLGAFLSGGVDSSTVVALMQAQSLERVKTFTIGFGERAYDEAPHARAVAAHLGTDHHELYVSPEDAMTVIPQLPTIYDEPFADSSQIPTHLVARLARRHVTVSLSGDGGDELFCGYQRYRLANKIRLLASLTPPGAPGALRALSHLLPPGILANRIERLSRALGPGGEPRIYQELVSQWSDPAALLVDSSAGNADIAWQPPSQMTDFSSRMMYHDTEAYLRDDILAKLDRASMAVSLETRVPLLDHRVVELAWRLPPSMKLRRGTSKWALRQVLYRYVPRRLVERPKMGFGVPVGSWLRGPLRAWADDLLAPERLKREGYLNAQVVRSRWEAHAAGRANWAPGLWNVLMFQSWLEAARAN